MPSGATITRGGIKATCKPQSGKRMVLFHPGGMPAGFMGEAHKAAGCAGVIFLPANPAAPCLFL